MGNYQKHEDRYIGKAWYLLYSINTHTAKPNPLPKDRTIRSSCPFQAPLRPTWPSRMKSTSDAHSY